MTIKAILWKYEPKQDGSCNIKIYVNMDGKKKYFKTKLSVLPKEFDDKKGTVKKSHPAHTLYNANLRSQILDIENHLLKGGRLHELGKKKSHSLLEFLQQYVDDTKKGLTSISISTCKSYSSLLKRLKEFCSKHRMNDISFDEVDLTFYDNFKKFLLEGEITGIPGFNKHIQILKASMNLALDKGLHENRSFQHKLFRKMPYKTNKIYLTEDEIKRIEDLDLSEHQNLQAEKERFLLSYYFITRYSDSVKLRRNNFFEKNGKLFLRYFQVKTGKVCVVPVRDAALTILEKLDFDLSSGTNQDSNRKLKTICAMAGINSPSQEGGKAGPKWMFVTTHTARRSAATHLALQGVNLKLIADLGGWEKVETLRTYLRASGLDSAEVAKDLAFFQ